MKQPVQVRLVMLLVMLSMLLVPGVFQRAGSQPLSYSLSGNWVGVWGSSRVSQGGLFAANLFQRGAALEGTAALNGSPCFGAFQISGVVFGNSFTFVASSRGVARVSVFGTVSGDSCSAVYAVLPSGTICDTDWGTINASRR
jgi:hypothetical protein